MRKKTILTGAVGAVLAAAGVTALPSAAGAAGTSSGASIVVEQNGVVSHSVCASGDVVLSASGFAPNRKSVVARIVIVGAGSNNPLFYARIQLVNGSGTVDTGSPGSSYIGDKFRVRSQTGSSDNMQNYAAYSAMIKAC